LPEHAFLFNTKVVDIQANTIITQLPVKQIQSDIVIVATEAAALISKCKLHKLISIVTNVYFRAA
jgi:hypothetical protein